MNNLTKQDQFQIKEEEGRRLFESFINQTKNAGNWQPTTGKYDNVDGYFNWEDKKVVVEIKTRDIKYMNYTTHLMEVNKYMNVAKIRADKKCNKALYACFFDNTLYLYDLRYVDSSTCKITDRYLPRTTAEDSDFVWKKCLEIPTKYAQVFKLDNEKWKQIKKSQA